MFPRYKHQEEFLLLPHTQTDKILLAWETGTGKSRSSIDWAVERIKIKESTTRLDVLVVCPISVRHKWDTEIAQFAPEYISHFTVMTKEQFKKHAPVLQKYDALIIDEAHYFSGMRPMSQISKALLAYIKKHGTKNIILLTATPYMSKPWNVFRLAKILGHTWNERDFEQEFYTHARMGMRIIPVLRANKQALLADYVAKIGLTKRLDECADVPVSNHIIERFTLNTEQLRAIKNLAYDANPVVRFGREHQICGGTLKGDGFRSDVILPTDKRQRVVDLAHEQDKLVVVCHYLLEIQALKEALNKSGITHVYTITGETKDREALIRLASNEPKAVLLVSSSCSEGWEFPTARMMIFYSYDFSLKNYIQMVGRIQRINNLQQRTYLSLIVDGHIDEDVHKNISNKKDFHIHIYANGR